MNAARLKVLALALDVQAVLREQQKNLTEVLSGILKAIARDHADDIYWKTVDDHIVTALELTNIENIKTELRKAQNALRQGMAIDYGDQSKEELQQLVIPLEANIERLVARCKELAVELESGVRISAGDDVYSPVYEIPESELRAVRQGRCEGQPEEVGDVR